MHSYCSPDRCTYLGNNTKSSTGSVIKRLTSLVVVTTLVALGIWTFTPVSKDADYKLDQAENSIHIDTRPSQQTSIAETDNQPTTTPELDSLPAGIKLPETLPSLTTATETGQLPQPFEQLTTRSPSPLPYDDHVERQFEAYYELVKSGPYGRVLAPSEDNDPTAGRKESFTIQSGDTLTRIFSRASLPISLAIELSKNSKAGDLNSLAIGKTLRIYFDENDQWKSLEYDKDKLNMLIVAPARNGFAINHYQKQVSYRVFTAQGTIESSLGMAAEQADISATVTQELTDIFKWEIDFARDMHVGDTFTVVYQKAFIDGSFVDDGPILAASINTGGRTIEAIRYTDSEGITAYFQPDGSSLRRSFLRTPVPLAHITSGFGKRFHPIKKTWKKHLGVDYGAKRGTPILATADGVVQYAGKKGGYGNSVILRHGGEYTTLYAHMSKIGKGVRSGKVIQQGQVIGYVGHTGWATGDHLHYEFRVNGQHMDPLKVKLPKSQPLAKKEMDTFRSQAKPLLATLTALIAAQVAKLDSTDSNPTIF